jgi:Ca2+-binding RTX toxin-like protein
MTGRTLVRICLFALVVLLIANVVSAVTATNTVAPSKAGNPTDATTANKLKPPECASLNLTSVVRGSGDFEGGSASELILGSSGADKIRGRSGNDCILGGGGNDELRGDDGTDVCIGGPGTDTLDSDCETRIQ